MRDQSYRGSEVGTYSVEAVPQVTKVGGCSPRKCSCGISQAIGSRRIGQNRPTCHLFVIVFRCRNARDSRQDDANGAIEMSTSLQTRC